MAAILGPTSGLTTEGVDVDALTRLMREYESKEEDWGRYALGDKSRGYTRNLVDVGNGKSNLLILVWSPNKGSLIHDHADAHCLMRILSGTLRETRYATPPSPAAAPPTVLKETTYSAGQVTYMSDSLGVHKISNPDPERMAVSLHLYTPPNAAKEGCHVWDERGGGRSHVKQNNYFSVMGVRGGRVDDLM
jgi:cysteine dioxygenase